MRVHRESSRFRKWCVFVCLCVCGSLDLMKSPPPSLFESPQAKFSKVNIHRRELARSLPLSLSLLPPLSLYLSLFLMALFLQGTFTSLLNSWSMESIGHVCVRVCVWKWKRESDREIEGDWVFASKRRMWAIEKRDSKSNDKKYKG